MLQNHITCVDQNFSCIGRSAHQLSGIGAPSSGAWPAANRALYLPFSIPEPVTVARMMYHPGTVAANIDIGIYSYAGALLVSSGTVAKGTTAQVEFVNVTDTPLAAGDYYFALVNSNNTGNFHRIQSSLPSAVPFMKHMGVLQEALGSTVLPSSMTPATPASDYYPLVGFTQSATF